jgi:hypothetical protein
MNRGNRREKSVISVGKLEERMGKEFEFKKGAL